MTLTRPRWPPGRWMALLLILLWTPRAADAQPLAAVTGVVKDDSGAPLPAVRISLHGSSNRVTETGPEGRFNIQGLPDGDYELNAALAGFAPSRRTFRLSAGERLDMMLTLSVLHEERTVVTASKIGRASCRERVYLCV